MRSAAAAASVPNWRQYKGDVPNLNRRGSLPLSMTARCGSRRRGTDLRQTTPKAAIQAAAAAAVPTGITVLHSRRGALRNSRNRRNRKGKRRTPRATMSSRIRRPFRMTATTTRTTSGTSVWSASGGCTSKNTAASRAGRGRAGRRSERTAADVSFAFTLFHPIYFIVRFWVSLHLSCPTHLSPEFRSPHCRPTRQRRPAPASVVLLRLSLLPLVVFALSIHAATTTTTTFRAPAPFSVRTCCSPVLPSPPIQYTPRSDRNIFKRTFAVPYFWLLSHALLSFPHYSAH